MNFSVNIIDNATSPSTNPLTSAGEILISMATSPAGIVTTDGSGSLAVINFHVNRTAPAGVSDIDLAADDAGFGGSGGSNATGISDGLNVNNYNSASDWVGPEDNTSLPPAAYSYTEVGGVPDPSDGAVTITAIDMVTASPSTYSITTRINSGDPTLTVAAPGVLANDTTTTGNPLTATLITNAQDGTVSLSPNGAFTYVPSVNFIGADSFVYEVTDPTITPGGGNTPSATTTVTLDVTPRLSIPTNLSGTPGHTVIVPVIMDDPNPGNLTNNGLAALALAVDYLPNVLTFNSVSVGSLTSTWTAPTTNDATKANAQQTIVLGNSGGTSTVSGGSFQLVFGTNTTGAISFSTASATLSSNIEAALTSLGNIGSGNTSLAVTEGNLQGTNPTIVVTFQGTLADQPVGTLSDIPTLLQGTNPTMSISVTTVGYSGLGQLGLILSNPSPVTTTSSGSVVLLTFTINAAAPGGETPVYIVPTNDPSGGTSSAQTVTTAIDEAGGQVLPLRPTLAPYPTIIPSVDGEVDVQAASFQVTAPSVEQPGVPFNFTVAALTATGTVNTAYTGAATFTSSDPSATLPTPPYTFTPGDAGIHTFTATLATGGLQTITATDATNSLTGSATISVVQQASQLVISADYDHRRVCVHFHRERGKLQQYRGDRLYGHRPLHHVGQHCEGSSVAA